MQDYQISSGTVSMGITLNDGDTMEVQADGVGHQHDGLWWAPVGDNKRRKRWSLPTSTVLIGAVSIEFVEPSGADN